MRIPTKALQDYPWLVRLILWAQKRKYGVSLSPALLLGRAPAILYGVQVLYRALDRKGSPIEPSLRSLLNIRVAQINHCSFCIDASSGLLRRQGISLEKISALPGFEESPLFAERERAALAYAEAMTYPDRGVTDEVFERVRRCFDEQAAVELTAVIGYQNMSSKFNAALGVPPQGFCRLPATMQNKEELPSA